MAAVSTRERIWFTTREKSQMENMMRFVQIETRNRSRENKSVNKMQRVGTVRHDENHLWTSEILQFVTVKLSNKNTNLYFVDTSRSFLSFYSCVVVFLLVWPYKKEVQREKQEGQR